MKMEPQMNTDEHGWMKRVCVNPCSSVVYLLFLAILIIVAAGAWEFRIPRLAERPVHGDEAIHFDRFKILWEDHDYIYDPDEYHGPTLNYFTLPVMWLTGTKTFNDSSEFTYRVVTVVFGVGLILLLALVADALGYVAAIAAAVLTAISPAMVFFSRYYIQEMLLVFFTFAAMAGAWRYWRGGSGWWGVLVGASLALMFATKETWVIAVASGVAGVVGAGVWGWVADRATKRRSDEATKGQESTEYRVPSTESRVPVLGTRNSELGTGRRRVIFFAVALVAFVVLWAACFTGGFKHWRGLVDSVLTYRLYLDRGTGAQVEHAHAHPWYTYFQWLFDYGAKNEPAHSEAFIATLAVVGAIYSIWPSRGGTDDRTRMTRIVGRFLAIYTAAMIVVYARISYKTPWCMLGFLHGLILLGGIGVAAIYRGMKRLPVQILAIVLIAAGMWLLKRQIWLKEWPTLLGKGITSLPPESHIFARRNPWAAGDLLAMLSGAKIALGIEGALALAALVSAFQPVLRRRALAGLLTAAVLLPPAWHLGRVAFIDSYVNYADEDRNPYVYGHPIRKMMEIVNRIDELMAVSPQGAGTPITIVTRDCWPLPWYLRRYPRVSFYEDIAPDGRLVTAFPMPEEQKILLGPIVVTDMYKASGVNKGLMQKYGEEYAQSHFGLRQRVNLTLFVDPELWKSFVQARNRKPTTMGVGK